MTTLAKNKPTDEKQTAIAPDDSWERAVASAKELPALLPKLKFGDDKLAEVTVDVECLEDKPRTVEFEDTFKGGMARAFVINVRVLSGPERGSSRALFIPTDESHGLTRGIMNAAKPRNGRMKGMALRIETKNYMNKTYKTKTRGYTVTEISPPDEVAP